MESSPSRNPRQGNKKVIYKASTNAVHFSDNGGVIPHAGLAPNFPIETVSEQNEWNAVRRSFIE
jgi:hypothetical protein